MIHWVGVIVLPVVVALVEVLAAVGAGCTVMVGWVVVVVVMTVRMEGDKSGHVPIGLFWMIDVLKDVSLFNSSSVEWVSLVCFGFIELES